MPIGIAAPNPSGIPGFNAKYGLTAGPGGGAVNARPLPSWYNIVTRVATANDSMSLPPAAPSMEVTVVNQGGAAMVVFGNTNPFGVQDTIGAASGGAQGTTGFAVPNGAVALFFVLLPQVGFTNQWIPGQWACKILT